MMNSEPVEAASSDIIQFNLQEASGDALAQSQKPVLRAKAQLEKDGAYKEVVKDKQELAGRGSRRAADDKWAGKVHQITGYRFGLVRDNQRYTTNEPSVTKVQPVPSRTPDTETIRMDRGVANIRNARSENQVRDFVENQIEVEVYDTTCETNLIED